MLRATTVGQQCNDWFPAFTTVKCNAIGTIIYNVLFTIVPMWVSRNRPENPVECSMWPLCEWFNSSE